MRKGTYTAIVWSVLIHGLILFIILITQSKQQKSVKLVAKKTPIKSFLYYAPNIATTEVHTNDTMPLVKPLNVPPTKKTEQKTQQTTLENKPKKSPTLVSEHAPNDAIKLPVPRIQTPPTTPIPSPKTSVIDSFTQLQRLRSKLNKSAATSTPPPYQRYQAQSVFNNNIEPVPHSVPLKDAEQERKKNTKHIGAGIAITKGADGMCSITQDMSVYGLREGSSIQYFSCGETKFDKSFQAHMKKVNTKLGKD